MFDLRYHVASLAAVFLALAIGILLGIGVADRGLIEGQTERFLRGRLADAEGSLEAANQRIAILERRQEAAEAYIEQSYPRVVEDRLAGKRIALLFVGSVDSGLRSSVEDALQDAGALPLLRLRALRVPLDEDALRVRYGGAIDQLGYSLGLEFVRGEAAPLWARVSGLLVEEQSGPLLAPADGAVVIRSAEPQRGATARFLRGLYSGIAAGGAPTAGIETTDAPFSAVEAFRRARVSTVDNVETQPGKLALIVLLAGGRPGNYGVKDSADDGVLPPLDSAPAPAAAG